MASVSLPLASVFIPTGAVHGFVNVGTGLLKLQFVIASVSLTEEGARLFKESIGTVITATRQEAANRAYEVLQSTTDPNEFITVEAWTSQAGLDAHLQTAHVQEFFGIVGPTMLAPPVLDSFAALAL